MDDKMLKQRIRGIQDDIRHLNNSLLDLEASNYKEYPESFIELSLDTGVRAEKIACRLRNLIGDYGIIKHEVLMEKVSEALNVEVKRDHESIVITIPRLLPKTKRARSGEFLKKPLHYALSKYCEENQTEKFENCVVSFVNVYDEKLSLERIRDCDNIEIRSILNMAAAFFFTDDSGLLCDVFQTTVMGKTDCTRVCITPKEKFLDFHARLKNTPNTISNFNGNL